MKAATGRAEGLSRAGSDLTVVGGALLASALLVWLVSGDAVLMAVFVAVMLAVGAVAYVLAGRRAPAATSSRRWTLPGPDTWLACWAPPAAAVLSA